MSLNELISPKAEGGYVGEVIKTPRPQEGRSLEKNEVDDNVNHGYTVIASLSEI